MIPAKHSHSFTAFLIVLLSFVIARFLNMIVFSFSSIPSHSGYYLDLQIESQNAIIFLTLFLVTYLTVKRQLDKSKIIITSVGIFLGYACILGIVGLILLTIQSVVFHTLLLGFIHIGSRVHHIFWYSLVTEIPLQILAVYLTAKIGKKLLLKNNEDATWQGLHLKNFHPAFCYSFSFAICTLLALFIVGILNSANFTEIEGSYEYLRVAVNTSILVSFFFIPLAITVAFTQKSDWTGKIWPYALGGFLNFILTTVLVILFLQFLIFIFYLGTFIGAFVCILLYYGIWLVLTLGFNTVIQKIRKPKL